jgi:hypothetical protein
MSHQYGIGYTGRVVLSARRAALLGVSIRHRVYLCKYLAVMFSFMGQFSFKTQKYPAFVAGALDLGN